MYVVDVNLPEMPPATKSIKKSLFMVVVDRDQ